MNTGVEKTAAGYMTFIAVGLLFAWNVQAQTHDEIQSLRRSPATESVNPYLSYSKQSSGKPVRLTGWLFRFYKNFISSQDYGNCNFMPSCSEYAIIAIREQGFLAGAINATDRLMRCHGKNRRHYLVDEASGLLIDEVRNHKYEKN